MDPFAASVTVPILNGCLDPYCVKVTIPPNALSECSHLEREEGMTTASTPTRLRLFSSVSNGDRVSTHSAQPGL